MAQSVTILCSIALMGCTLIDQRTFNPAAGEPFKVPAASGVASLALLTIDLAKARPEYQQSLSRAVADAVMRKPDVEFDVVSVVPVEGTPAQQVAAATGITADAREIARAINRDGIDDGRIHLAARSDAGVKTRQVQIFVR